MRTFKILSALTIFLSVSACSSLSEQDIMQAGGYQVDLDKNLHILSKKKLPLKDSTLTPDINGKIAFIGNTTTNSIKGSVTDIYWRKDGTMHGISKGGSKTRQGSEGTWKVINSKICVDWVRNNWPDTCTRSFYDPKRKQLHEVLDDGTVWISIFNYRPGNPENL